MRPGKKAHAQAKTVDISERTIQALDMAKKGYTYLAISQALGVSPETTRKDIIAAAQANGDLVRELGADYLYVHLGAIDEMIVNWRTKANAGDTDAAQVYLKALDMRAKLLGLGQENTDNKQAGVIVLAWQGGQQGTLTMTKGDTSVTLASMDSKDTEDADSLPAAYTVDQPTSKADDTASGVTGDTIAEDRVAGSRRGLMSQPAAPTSADDTPTVIPGSARAVDSKDTDSG